MDINKLYEELDQLYGKGEPEQVEAFLKSKKADGTVQATQEKKYDLLIWSSNELGSLYRGLGRFDDSEQAFLKAIEVLSTLEGDHREELAITYNNLGGTYRMAGRQNEALNEFKNAMDIYADLESFDVYGYASAFNNLALVYESQGQTSQAIEYLLVALENLQNRGMKLPVAISQTNLALLLQKIGQTERAKELLRLAEDTFAHDFPGDYHQAALFAAKGNLEAAEQNPDSILSFQNAAEIIKANYGESHEYQMMQKNIAILLERFGPGACKQNTNEVCE